MLHRILGGAALSLALTSTLALSQSIGLYGKAVQIDPAQPNTVVMQVTSGQTYAMFVAGVYAYASNDAIAYPTVWLSAGGNGQIPHAGPEPSLPFGSIYARIGNGPAFLIGERRTFVADQTGELRLWVNDNNTGDNVGRLVAFIYSNGPTL